MLTNVFGYFKAATIAIGVTFLPEPLKAQDASGLSDSKQASFFDFMKGCVWVGGLGAGGTSMAISSSGAKPKDSSAMAVGALASCLIGGFIVSDVFKKANVEASMELRTKNQQLRNQVWGVMHDLCVMKKTCGADGLTIPQENENFQNIPIKGFEENRQTAPGQFSSKDGLLRLKSGN
jgi:hypothetical protein